MTYIVAKNGTDHEDERANQQDVDPFLANADKVNEFIKTTVKFISASQGSITWEAHSEEHIRSFTQAIKQKHLDGIFTKFLIQQGLLDKLKLPYWKTIDTEMRVDTQQLLTKTRAHFRL